MKFLKALLWVAIATLVAMFAARNWRDITLNLWGDLQADIKIPLLLLIMFLIGFLPAWATYRARLWSAKRRGTAVAAPPVATEATAREEISE